MRKTHVSDGTCDCYGCTWGDDRECRYCGEVCGAEVCRRCDNAADQAQEPDVAPDVSQLVLIPHDLF